MKSKQTYHKAIGQHCVAFTQLQFWYSLLLALLFGHSGQSDSTTPPQATYTCMLVVLFSINLATSLSGSAIVWTKLIFTNKRIRSWRNPADGRLWLPCNTYPCRTSYFLCDQINVWNARLGKGVKKKKKTISHRKWILIVHTKSLSSPSPLRTFLLLFLQFQLVRRDRQ